VNPKNALRVESIFWFFTWLNMKIGGKLMRKATLVLVCLMVLATMTACQRSASQSKDQVLTLNLGIAEPETLDPAKSTGVAESTIELNLHEGLTRLDKDGNPTPGIAENWDISEDGKTYTFYLRDAEWNNGDPITAHDFEWSWKRALAPETAAEYAYQLWYIKNAQAYTEGNATADEVGVKAIDDHTLQVELIAPTGYFLSLCAFPTLLPVHRATVEANPDRWFMDPETYVSAGPFKMTAWEHNSKVVLEKNERYWDAKSVKLDKVVVTLTDSQITELSMFETGEIDFGDNPPRAELNRLIDEGKLFISPYLGSYYYMYNVDVKPLNDVRVRKALSMAIDRTVITEITGAGEQPATAYVPGGIPDIEEGTDFREAGGKYIEPTAQIEEAQRLLAEAGYPDGKGFPVLSILYNTNEMHKTIAEAIQEMWKKNLGIDITLTNQEWGVYLESRNTGDYDISRAGWIGDYVDPMTFLDMWVTGGGNNDTNWGNPEYDRLINIAMNSTDQAERVTAMHEAENILMEELPIIPIYFYTRPYLMKPWVKDMVRLVTGHIDLKHTYIEKH
jgi:oligopeptide transport system substrate-binding protein